MMYTNYLRPLLFRASAKDPEIAHEKALAFLSLIGRHTFLYRFFAQRSTVSDQRLQQKIWGLSFQNPVGLAAGFDKNGVALEGLASLGFSHIEMGTVTPLEQEGNPRPRMFRFPKDEALINRMGFNNGGVNKVANNLFEGSNLPIPLGISMGKGKATSLEEAPNDYLRVLNALFPYANYFVVNISSPNTPGIRDLQEKKHLTVLLPALQNALQRCAKNLGYAPGAPPKPILVKIAPDLEWEAIDDVMEVSLKHGVSGLIATNTTLSREGLSVDPNESGGMSGKPLLSRSLDIVCYLRRYMPPNFPIIGVGGIMTPEDAYMMLRAGANLLQVYTGFVYGGPFFVRDLNLGILSLMERDGIAHISELQRSGF